MHSEAISPEPSSGADPSLFRLFGRISDHHTHIETDKNKIKVKTQSQTPVNRNAFQKIPGIDLTLVIRCQPIVFQIPDVTGISEHGAIELPEEAKEEKICPNCGAKMVIKRGRYGQFWACSNYPECKTIESLKKKAKPEPTGEMCPECGHELVRRKSRFGTTFIGCSNYPKCHYIKKESKKTEEDK